MSEEHPSVGNNDPLIGTVLAERYRIERRLGEGGMGAVYLARHVILEKIVALKILHAEYARRRELVERFLHEAKAASRIRHEHVIDITDFGETADKNVFFAMEYLEGADLATVLDREGALPWRRVKSMILQLCAALQAAHEAGVIHRDLKPENIYLIERLGNSDFIKVLDFGVAKLTEVEEGGRERRLTRTGMVFGTPEYMSPEQARGEKPDPRVDIYATGCILFEMLSGDVPFRGDNFMGVLSKHLFDPAPLLIDRTARTDIPDGVQAVISQAMAKDKNQRFSTMNELAVALDTVDSTEGIVYLAPGAAKEMSRRHAVPGGPPSAARAAQRPSSAPAARVSAARPTPAAPRPSAQAAARPNAIIPRDSRSSYPHDATLDDDAETTLRKQRPLKPVDDVAAEDTTDERPRRPRSAGPRGLVVFLIGGAVAVVLGLGALAVVRLTRGPGSAEPPEVEAPTVATPVVATPLPGAAPDAAAAAVPSPVVTTPPPEAVPPAPAVTPPIEVAPPDAGTVAAEPTVITVPDEPEVQPERPTRRPSSSTHRRDRDRGKDRDRRPLPPVVAPETTLVASPPATKPEPKPEPPDEPAVPKSDLKDPFRKK